MKKEPTSLSQHTTKISYDTVAKSLYIKMSKNKIFKTKEISLNCIVDIDRKGQVVGVEILNTNQKTSPNALKSWLAFSQSELLVK